MQRLLIMLLFSSILSADNEIKCGEVSSIPVEETECIIIKGNAVPAPAKEPVVVYPIEDFLRIEEDR